MSSKAGKPAGNKDIESNTKVNALGKKLDLYAEHATSKYEINVT